MIAPLVSPRCFYTRGVAHPRPGSTRWVAEVVSTPEPTDPHRCSVQVKIGGLIALTLAHVPLVNIPQVEAFVSCLHLDRVVTLLELKPSPRRL